LKLVPLKSKLGNGKNSKNNKFKNNKNKKSLRHPLPKDIEHSYEYLNVPAPKKMLYLNPLD